MGLYYILYIYIFIYTDYIVFLLYYIYRWFECNKTADKKLQLRKLR